MPRGLFSQYRIGRDFLYMGCVTCAIGLLVAMSFLFEHYLLQALVAIWILGMGFAFIIGAIFVEARMKQMEELANPKPGGL